MSFLRLFFLALGLACVPFALARHNGATVLGVLAVISFIALTIYGAPHPKGPKS